MRSIVDNFEPSIVEEVFLVLRYIYGTINHGLEYKKKNLIGYTNQKYVGFIDDRKSTSRFFFFLVFGPIS